jgi:hypothetical protein
MSKGQLARQFRNFLNIQLWPANHHSETIAVDLTLISRFLNFVHPIQIIQPTRCNIFTSLLLDVYVWLNMFWSSPRPSSGAYNCARSFWFYRWMEVAEALLVVVWHNLSDHNQQRSGHCSQTVKPEAPSAVVCSWWWVGRRPKLVEPHINVK